jgi:hypothetical protein
MKGRNNYSLVLDFLLVTASGASAFAQSPSAQFLERVASNVAEQQRSIPDFVANEDVTVQELENGKHIHEKHIVSQFQAVHNEAKGKFGEQRQVLSATEDGKPLNRTGYVLPLGVRGGFADDASKYFGKANMVCFDIDTIRQDQMRGRNVTVVAIRRKKSSLADSACSAAYKIDATAWVDAETLRILRLELGQMKEREYNGPFSRANGVFDYAPAIDYGEAQIAGRSYWVPIEKRVDFVKEDGKVTFKYVVQYSQFHKFASTASIIDNGK